SLKMRYFLLFSNRIHPIAMTMCTRFSMRITFLVKTIVTVDTDPVHFSAVTNLLLTYYRNVVLYITGYDTSTTACTRIQVNCHHPVITWRLIFIPQIVRLVFRMVVS